MTDPHTADPRRDNNDRLDDEPDPYGLPRFAGERDLPGWTDHSDIALRTVRVFTRGATTATVISHPGVWDLIVSDGTGSVAYFVYPPQELAEAIRSLVP
jgi:hypothetical protein